jgi:uncharacterized protein YjbI with pentapeptide repeats
MTQANFEKANLQSATLDKTTLNQADLSNADMTKASLQSISALGALFPLSILRQANLTGANLAGAVMHGAKMDQSNLTGATFDGTDLRGTILKDATLTNATFKDTRINRFTVLPIPMATAVQMGMYVDNSTSLLLIDDENDSDTVTIMAAMQAKNIPVTVCSQNNAQFAGDFDLSLFSAILHNGDTNSADMPAGGQAALLSFVQAGGTYIGTGNVLAAANGGLFTGMPDLLLLKFVSAQSQDWPVIVQTGMAAQPVLSGEAATVTLPGINYVVGTLNTFTTNPSSVLMADAQNNPAVVVRTVGLGKVVNFAVCNGQNGDACLENTDIQNMIANAVNWQ